MSGHTPGPWTSSNEGWGDACAQVRSTDGSLICSVPIFDQCPSGDGDLIDNPELAGNRSLICEAPAMLEMLETMLALRIESIRSADFGHTDNPDDPDLYPEVAKARAIIARAKGEA